MSIPRLATSQTRQSDRLSASVGSREPSEIAAQDRLQGITSKPHIKRGAGHNVGEVVEDVGDNANAVRLTPRSRHNGICLRTLGLRVASLTKEKIMISLTTTEHLIRRVLVQRARAADVHDSRAACLSYAALGLAFDPEGVELGTSRPPFRPLFPMLGHVSMYEVEHGRPMLSALVVTKETGLPGDGFAKLARHLGIPVGEDETAFWDAQLARVVEFWTDDDPTLVLDAALDRVTRELAAIRAVLR